MMGKGLGHVRSSAKRMGIAAAILIAVYVLAVFILPSLKIWAVSKSYKGKETRYEPIQAGKTYNTDFLMPFNRLCSVSIPMEQVEESEYIVAVDAVLTVLDSDGVVIVSKKIASAYDDICEVGYISVQKEGAYSVRLQVLSVGGEQEYAPVLLLNDNGNLCFTIKGNIGSSNNKFVFGLMYTVVSLMVLVYVFSLNKGRIGDAQDADTLITGVLMILAVFAICQFIDLYDISRSALSMMRSFQNGHLRYMDSGYLDELKEQSTAQRFVCDYNFSIIAVVAIAMLPIYPFYFTSMPEYWKGYAPVLALSFFLLVLVRVVVWLFKFIVNECDMDERYLSNVRTLFMTSSLLLFVTLGFGQIDIIYIAVIVLALPFYYRKNYLAFSMIMSVAVAMKTLPILIFAPLILLAVKKVRDIIVNTAVVMIVPLVTKLVFGSGVGYSFITGINEETYGYTGRIIDTSLGENVSVFILVFSVLCVFVFLHKPNTENKKEMLYKSMMVIFLSYTCFAAFVPYHIQWLIPLAFAFSFLAPLYKENRNLLLLSVVMEALIILEGNFYNVSIYHLLNGGVIAPVTGQSYEGTGVVEILNNISPILPVAVKSASIGVLICVAGYMWKQRKQVTYECCECPRQWVIGRTGILYAFILFYSWCFSYIG